MGKQLIKRYALLFAAACIFVSCSSGQSITEADTVRIGQLGKDFQTYLDEELLYIWEDTDRLREQAAVIVTENKTYNIAYYREFFRRYEAGEAAELTTVFQTKSFVVMKMVVENGKIYHFRYEMDPFDRDAIVITSQMVDEIQQTEDAALRKVEVTLTKKRQSPIVVTYKNIEEAEAS